MKNLFGINLFIQSKKFQYPNAQPQYITYLVNVSKYLLADGFHHLIEYLCDNCDLSLQINHLYIFGYRTIIIMYSVNITR